MTTKAKHCVTLLFQVQSNCTPVAVEFLTDVKVLDKTALKTNALDFVLGLLS